MNVDPRPHTDPAAIRPNNRSSMSGQAQTAPSKARRLPLPEFAALLGLLFATVAFSIDAMLPALGAIGAALEPADPGRAQLVVTVFVAGLGIGTIIVGPLSDALGRKPVILVGLVLYALGAALAARAESLTVLLFARALQGLGAAAPRIVGQALVRDLYVGPAMARVMSFAMALFVLVPMVAPLLGAAITAAFGWRAIFWAFVIFAAVGGLWFGLRQDETLPPACRRALSVRVVLAALREIFALRPVRLYLVALSAAFATMFAWLASLPLIFSESFGRGAEFPFWFAAISVVAAPAALLNGRLVVRLGLVPLVTAGLLSQLFGATVLALTLLAGVSDGAAFAVFVAAMLVQFFTVASVFGNLNALALAPLGHVAGTAASVMGGISTLGAAAIATVIARAFDGTPLPLALGAQACALLALGSVALARQRK